jgi:hypothetical protein
MPIRILPKDSSKGGPGLRSKRLGTAAKQKPQWITKKDTPQWITKKDKPKWITRKKKNWITKKKKTTPWITKKKKPTGLVGGRKGYNIGGRANLLEEMGRIDARRHPDAADRAEKRRVIGELNRGYKSGGAVLKGKKVGCQIK